MSKYIIEIAEEYEEYFKGVLICGIADGKFAVDVIAREDLEELNSDYINEHYGSLQDEAYQKGFEEGKKSIDLGCEDCKYHEDTSLTNPCSECTRAWKDHYTPAPHSDRIEVGDEVRAEEGHVFVVTGITDKGSIYGFDKDGMWLVRVKDRLRKTGKHYDIASILEAMRTHD